MSLAIRTVLRPVVWSDVDSRGHTLRRPRSPSCDPPSSAPPPNPGAPGQQPQQQQQYAPDATGYPPRKKLKQYGSTSALYYPPALSPSEKLWRDRYTYLLQRGYQLRPRYSPNWTPTAFGNGRHHHSGEDHIMQILPQVLDGIRREDGLVVCIKMIQDTRKAKQIQITEYFSTRRLTADSRNHVVPFYDAFMDNFSPHIQFMVMPVLRRFDDPEFRLVVDVVDFVSQVLEGLTFLHENNVAHHNLTAEHIMMDAKTLIPTGWHFVSHFCEPDGMTRIAPLDRRHLPVRYYFVGFGNCYHIPPDQKPLVMDIGGSDDDVPELFKGRPYDPYKLDVYTLGNVFLRELYQKYTSLDFLDDLIKYMRIPEFEKRPGADKVLRRWYRIRDVLNEEEIEETVLCRRERPREGKGKEQHRHPSGGRERREGHRDERRERDRDGRRVGDDIGRREPRRDATDSPTGGAGSGSASSSTSTSTSDGTSWGSPGGGRSNKRDITSILNR